MASSLEVQFEVQIREAGLPKPEREWRFHETRKWRFDFCWPAAMLAAEVDGGTWVKGRHTRGQGFESDCEKINAAQLDGWLVLRFTGAMIRDGRAIRALAKAIGQFYQNEAA